MKKIVLGLVTILALSLVWVFYGDALTKPQPLKILCHVLRGELSRLEENGI